MKGLLIALVIGLASPPLLAQEVPSRYRNYFYKYEDDVSVFEWGLNQINLSSRDVGYSVALIAGVWEYPQARSFGKTLEPARVDVEKLKRHLRDHEYFHEIIVLENEAVTFNNLKYFLNVYIPERVKSPKSRFFFAYSGHGMQDGRDGYLLESSATTLADRSNATNLRFIRTLLDEVVKEAYHTLITINSCYSGDFIRVAYGGDQNPSIPRDPGAHVITAGSTGQLVYGQRKKDEGSDFYELLLAGLDRRADTAPIYEGRNGQLLRGDGIITTDELASYLRGEFRRQGLDEGQMPQAGDIAPLQSLGSFFFIGKGVRVKEGALEGRVGRAAAFGEAGNPVETADQELEDLVDSGMQLLKNGEAGRAIAAFTQSISENPGHARAYYNRGLAYSSQEDYDAVISDYSRAIELDPGLAPPYYNRGKVYREIGAYNAADADEAMYNKLMSRGR